MGIGYGRNGKYFADNNYAVDGIEYSEEAITLGKMFCPQIKFINASALNVKLNRKYNAVFCYSIVHLFTENDRNTLLENCIQHCKENGIIAVSCCSVDDKTYGIGNEIEKNTFEIKPGKILHFYTEEEIKNISDKLECIAVDHTTENIETDERREEYKMIYGIYKIRK